MSLHELSPVAIVATVIGNAWARSQDGLMRLVKSGDIIYQGEVIVTTQGGRVLLELPDGSLYPVQGDLLAELQQPESDNREPYNAAAGSEAGADDGQEQENTPAGVGATEEIGGAASVQSASGLGGYSDEPSGYLRLQYAQDIEQVQLVEGGNSFAPVPVLLVSIVGGYSDGTGARSGGYDEFLDGRATYNPRLIEGTDLLRADSDAFGADLRTFDGSGDDDEYVNRLPEPLPDVAEVVEGGNTVSGNVLANDADGNGRSTVISITYVPEGGGDPETEEVPAGGSVTVDSLYGILTIYSDGSWEYLSDPYEAHDAPPSDAPLQDLFTYTVKDVDGDRASSTLTIDVIDTEPSIGTPEPGVVDEDDLDPNGTDLNADGKQPEISGSLGVKKAADPLDTTFLPADEQNDLNDLNLQSAGNDVQYVLLDDGHTLVGYAGTLPASGIPDDSQRVFTVVINDPTSAIPDGPTYTFTLYQQLDHPFNDGENDIDLPFEFKVLDHDGDSDTDTVVVKVIDDVPVLGTTPYNINVQEDALSTGNPDTTSDTTTGTITYANLSGLVHVGADEPAQFSLNTSVSGAVQTTGGSDVYSQGSLVSYHVNGSVIEGKSADGRIVFTLTQTAGSSTADPTDDEFTYELKDQLDHPVPGSTDDDQTMVLNLSPAIVATDKDADPISLGSQLTVTVEDDVPVLGTTPYNINVQEDALPTGNPDTTSDTTTGTITYANLSGLVHVGADEPAQFSLNTSVSGAVQTTGGSDVYSQGSLVSYHVNGSVIEGKSADGRIVFTLTQTAGSSTADPTDDEFTYELKDQLDHPVPGSTDDDQTMVLEPVAGDRSDRQGCGSHKPWQPADGNGRRRRAGSRHDAVQY